MQSIYYVTAIIDIYDTSLYYIYQFKKAESSVIGRCYMNKIEQLLDDIETSKLLNEINNQLLLLTRLSKLIFSLYLRVYNLEINGQKNTKYYEREMYGLINNIKIERQCYEKLLYNRYLVEDVRECVLLLISKEMSRDTLNFESSLSESYSNLIIIRVLLRLDNIIARYKNIHLVKRGKNPLDINQQEAINGYINTEIAKNDLLFIQENVDNNLINIREKMHISNVEICINRLIKAKYDIAYSLIDLEDYMINNNFNVSNALLLDSKDKRNAINVDDETYEIAQKNIASSQVNVVVNQMLDINNKQKIGEENAMDLVLKQCNLRAIFLMVDEEKLEQTDGILHNYFESKDYALKNINDHFVEELIFEALRKVNKGKSNYESYLIKKLK